MVKGFLRGLSRQHVDITSGVSQAAEQSSRGAPEFSGFPGRF
jgi:hypothetical protein